MVFVDGQAHGRARFIERLEECCLVRVEAGDSDGHRPHLFLVRADESIVDELLDGNFPIVNDEDDATKPRRIHPQAFNLERGAGGERELLFGAVVEVVTHEVGNSLIGQGRRSSIATNGGNDGVSGQVSN